MSEHAKGAPTNCWRYFSSTYNKKKLLAIFENSQKQLKKLTLNPQEDKVWQTIVELKEKYKK